MSWSEPIEEAMFPEVTDEYIARRTADWFARLDALYGRIRDWAAEAGWTVEPGDPAPMDGAPLGREDFRGPDQPTLRVRDPEGREVLIRPKGLWVAMANGHLDLLSANGSYTLTDRADAFQPPQWTLRKLIGGTRQAFDPALIADMV